MDSKPISPRRIRHMLLPMLCLTSVALLALVTRSLSEAPGDESQSKIKRGFQIAPVLLNMKGKNPAMVGLGSYLVNAGGACNDCHSCPTYAPGHSPYMGEDGQINADNYLAGGVPFGPFVSRNLTPDDQGRPAGLTLEEFVEVIRTGVDEDNVHPAISPLLQVMPWPIYRNLTDHDLRAIYEYLSAIPHAEPGVACSGPGE